MFLASMFEFEKLETFRQSVEFYQELRKGPLNSKSLERYEKDQLGRSALSVVANIAEGNGVRSKKSKANYLRIAGGSLTESAALLILFKEIGLIAQGHFKDLYSRAERISRMLMALIRYNQKD
jgi:four helix bundle protein